MKKIIIISFITFLLISTLFITNTTKAITYTDLLVSDFDGVASGLDFGTEGYFTFKNMGAANDIETCTDYDLTSPNSLKMVHTGGLGYGYLNLTTLFNYIKLVNFSFFTSDSGGSNYIRFYNNSKLVLDILIDVNEIIKFYDVSSAIYKTVYDGLPATRYYILIQHNITNQFWIRVFDATFVLKGQIESAGAYAGDYLTFTYIKLVKSGGYFYFDNFYIKYSDTIPTIYGYTEEFCNGGQIGTYEYASLPTTLGYGAFVESRYYTGTGLGLTGNITQISLKVSNDQYINANSTNYYTCVVNGNDLGTCDSISGIGNDWSVDWYNVTIPILNNQPIFSFACTHLSFGLYYWFGLGLTLSPTVFKYHSSNTLHHNNIFDYYSYDNEQFGFRDLSYCFTVEDFIYGNYTPITSPNDFINTSLYFDFYDAKTGIKLQVIDLDHAYYTDPIYNNEKNRCMVKLSLTAISSGGNETHLYNMFNVAYGSSESVFYEKCRIAPYSLNTVDFLGGSMGNIVGYINDKQVIWYRYTRNIKLYPYGTEPIYLTRLGDINITEPVPPDVITEYEDLFGEFFIQFYNYDEPCEYRVGSSPILIYEVNDTKYSDVNGYIWEIKNSKNVTVTNGKIYPLTSPEIKFIFPTWIFTTKGEYQIFLYNITIGNKKDEQVYESQIITVCQKTGEGETPIFGFIIPDWLKLIFGIIITLMMTMLPLFISFALSKGNIDITIPPLVYVAFFFFGLIISCMPPLNLLSPIIPLIILIGLIIAFAVMWVRGQTSG